MSDDKLDLKLNVDVDVHDAEKAKALREELARIDAEITAIGKHTNDGLRALGLMARAVTGFRTKGSGSDTAARTAVEGERELYAELRKRFAFERRMNAQRRAEDSESARAAREEAREVESRFRAQMAWNSRIAAQRAREEKAAESEIQREIRETGRMRDREARKALTDARALRREQEKAAQQVRTGAGQVRAGAGRAVVAGGATAGALVYGGKRTLDRLTRSGVDIDAAMNANARMEIGLSPKEARAKVEAVRENYKPLARRLGQSVAELLRTRSESLQAGVDSEIVDSVVENATKYAILNGLNPSEAAESSGYGLTALSAHGKVTKERAANLFNKQQYLAATTAASRQGLASFVRRGLASGAMAGFSDDDSLAYGAAGTAAGADGESVARALSSTQERLATMPTRAAQIARKHNKTLQDRILLGLPKKLGFASWKDVKASFLADAAGTTDRLYQGLGAIQDPRERLELAETLFGKEFGSMHAGMAAGGLFHKMRDAVRSKEAGGALDAGMAIEDTSFPMIIKQIGATVTELLNDLGLELKQYWSDLRDWIVKTPKAFQSFQLAFREGLTGFVTGLGSPDGSMSGLLKSWMGDPGSFQVNARAVGDFARGVGQGLRDIGSAIRSFVGVFAGQNASPEELGRWSARILGLSAALLVAAPAVAVLGGLATAIGGFTTAVLGAWRLLKASGLVGATGAGSAPVVGGTAAGAGLMGRMAAWFSRLAPALAMPFTTDASKEDQDKLMRRLGAYALEIEKQKKATQENTDALHDGAAVQKQSWQRDDFRGLIHKASITTGDAVSDSIRSTARSVINGSVGSGSGSGDGPAIAHSTPGGSLGNGLSGMYRSGIISRTGGSRSWRNSNPGNIEYGEFAKSMGATGSDGRFAVFPDYQTGRKAQEKLLFESKSYRDLTLAQAIRRWAPGSENNVPAYIRAMGADPSKRMRDFTPEERGRLQDAMQRHEGWREGVVSGGGSGVTSKAVDAARGLIGAGSRQAAAALGSRMTPGSWCADFVNGALRTANVKGVNSSVATSFLNWGQRVLDGVKPGDVVVTPRGRGPGQPGGHVGIATGETRMRNGRLQYQTVSGNHGNRVGLGWEDAASVAVRRAQENAARMQEQAKAISAPPPSLTQKGGQSLGDIDVTGPRGRDITKGVPLRPNLSSGGGNSGGPGSVVNNITVNAANHSPQEMAGAVQRHLQDAMNRRTHDYDGFA